MTKDDILNLATWRNSDELELKCFPPVFGKSNLEYLLICENDQDTYTNNYGLLTFDNEWNGHLTVVVMKNGDLVGFGDSGLYLGKYEE